MKKELNYQFRQRMAIVHIPNRRDPAKKPTENQIEIDSTWTITIPRDADVVLKNACRDLEDYFFTSMGVSPRVMFEDEASGKQIVYTVDATLPKNSYRLTVAEDKILLCGQTTRDAAQAGYFVEDLMNLDEAPVIEKQEIVRTSLFNPRMIHSGYGLDMFPEEYLRHVAHSGITSLLLFVNDVDDTPHGYQDFNDLCIRAAAWGVDVYAYSYIANRRHPDDPDAEEFYENWYGRLFDRCPYFRGIIFVGESCEFPSKDPHTSGLRRLDNIDENGNRIKEGCNPGWWPCYDYPDWLNLVKKIIFKRKPDADIVFWSYNWGAVEPEYRENYDIAVARGVARMNILCEWCLPFVKVGGYFVAMKGEKGVLEADEARKAIATLGGELVDIIDIKIPEYDYLHTLIIVKKIKQTPKKYPRRNSQIQKKPL